jgi:hypothetical protein
VWPVVVYDHFVCYFDFVLAWNQWKAWRKQGQQVEGLVSWIHRLLEIREHINP